MMSESINIALIKRLKKAGWREEYLVTNYGLSVLNNLVGTYYHAKSSDDAYRMRDFLREVEPNGCWCAVITFVPVGAFSYLEGYAADADEWIANYKKVHLNDTP
jgi:hypothetical protein